MSEDQLHAELECAKQELAELRAELAAAKAERDTAMEKAAEAYRELDAHQQAGQLMASQCELVNAEQEAAVSLADEQLRLVAAVRNEICELLSCHIDTPNLGRDALTRLRKFIDERRAAIAQEQDNG